MIIFFLLLQFLFFLLGKADIIVLNSFDIANCTKGCCSFIDCLNQTISSPIENLTIYLNGDYFLLLDTDFKTTNSIIIPENYTRVIADISCQNNEICAKKALILLKTEKLSFDVRGSFLLKNLQINANDLHISNSKLPCLYTVKGCCDETNYTNKSDVCFLMNKIIARNDRSNLNPLFTMNNNTIGIISNLVIDTCEIKYFYAIKSVGLYTLILVDIYSANIIFNNTIISDFYLLEGVITASFNRKRKAIGKNQFKFYFENSLIQKYNNYDFNEKVNTFYGSLLSIANVMAFQNADKVLFVNSTIKNMGYKILYISTCYLAKFKGFALIGFEGKIENNDLFTFYSTTAQFQNSSFSYINTKSKVINAPYSNVFYIYSSIFNEIFITKTNILFFSQSSLLIKLTSFFNISMQNSASLLQAYYGNLISLSNNEYNNITNQIYYLYASNKISSKSEYFSNIKIFNNDYSLIFFYQNNAASYQDCFFRNFIQQTQSTFIINKSNQIHFKNISVFSMKSDTHSGFLNLISENTLFIESSIFGSIFSASSSILTCLDFNTISINNTDFSKCFSTLQDGGLFSISTNNNISFSKCVISSSGSNHHGGFIYLDSNNTMSLTANIFTKVSSSSFGGVIHCNTLNVINITKNVFRNCLAYNNGLGGIFFLNSQNSLSIIASLFSNNFAYLGGVGYFTSNNIIELNKSEFTLNHAQQGGCIFLDNSNVMNIWATVFFNSSSKVIGGVIGAITVNTLNLSESQFIKSYSQIGGIIYLNSMNKLFLTKILLNISYSTERGGCINMNDKNLLLINQAEIENSESFEESGCIYSYVLNSLFLDQVSFRNIYAKLRGGAIFLYFNSNLTLSNSNFTNTYADMRGGCIFNSNRNILILKNIIIEDSNDSPEFQFVIFFLNNNIFKIDNIKFLKGEFGIFISHFNVGNFSNISIILNNNNKIEKINYSKSSLDQNQNLQLDFFNEDKIFLAVYSSEIRVSNLNYFNLTYPMIYSLHSKINLENITFNFCVIARDESYLMEYHGGSIIIKKISLLYNQANILISNSSNITITALECLYNSSSNKIFNFFNSKFNIKSALFEYVVSSNQRNESMLSKFFFDQSHLIFTRVVFINNFGAKGAALKITNSNATINRCSFLMNKAEKLGGAIFYEITTSSLPSKFFINLHNSIFIKNKAVDCGGAINFASVAKSIMKINVKFCSFIGNKANLGGALYIKEFSELKLSNSSFKRNKGIKLKNNTYLKESKGGAIHVANDLSKFNYSFTDLKFIENKADIGGVFFFNNYHIPLADFRNFTENQASLYGPIQATYPTNISFGSIYEKYLKESYFSELQSGSSYNCLFTIIGYDRYGQLVVSDNYDISAEFSFFSFLKADGKKTTSNSNLYLKNNHDGLYCADNSLIMNPYFSSQIFFKINFFNSVPLRLSLNFRSCKMGEIIQQDFCQTCPFNSYSLNSSLESNICIDCTNSEKFYCYGGSNLTPKPGYWRLNYYSDNFLLCPNSHSCLGYHFKNASLYNPLMASGECEIGYKGVLCAECIDDYGVSDKFFCSKCESTYIFFYILASLIFKVVIILFSVHKAIIMSLSLITSNTVNLRKVVSSILMKILFNHLQCLIIVFSIPSLIMPDMISNILYFSKASSPNLTEVISLECGLKNLKLNIRQQVLKMVMIWTSPLIILIISSLYLAFYLKNKKKKIVIENIHDRLRIWFAIFITVIMILYPDCMKICFEAFNCINVGFSSFPQYQLAADYSMTCWKGEHMSLIYGAATPFLLLFGIGFPLFVLINLISHWKGNSLNNKAELLKYGYFYFGYDKQFFFWDMVILLRKISILLIDVFFLTKFNQELVNQPVLAIFLVLFISLYIQLIYQPYRKDKLNLINSLENKSLIALVGTVYVGLLNKEMVFGETSISSLVLFIFVFFINLNFAIFWLLAFFNYIISDKLKKWKISLISCFINSYSFIKRNFQQINKPGTSRDKWAKFDNYTIELKKKARRAIQTPLQENLIEQIRRTSIKDLKKIKTIGIKQPDRFKCNNCEMTLKIEEENKKLRDQLFIMREKMDNKDIYLKELQSKLLLMKTMGRSNKDIKNLDLDIQLSKSLKYETENVLSSNHELDDTTVLMNQLKDHFNLVRCLHPKEKLLSKQNYEISARIFLYTSKDLQKEFYVNFVLLYDFECELNDMFINYEYDKERMSKHLSFFILYYFYFRFNFFGKERKQISRFFSNNRTFINDKSDRSSTQNEPEGTNNHWVNLIYDFFILKFD